MARRIIFINTILCFFWLFLEIPIFAQESKTVLLNQELDNVGDNFHFYISSVTVSQMFYKISFHFLNDSDYTSFSTKIDNIYVGNYEPVSINGLILGKYYDNPNHPKFSVVIPRKYKKLYIIGVGTSNEDLELDLSQYDAFMPEKKIAPIEKTRIDSSKPVITISSPQLYQNIFRTEDFSVIINGKASDKEGIAFVTVNGGNASLRSDGTYQQRVKLKIGMNPINIKAIDINDNEAELAFTIIREEILADDEFSDVDFALETGNKNSNGVAVVFGIEEYMYAPSVTFAYNDAEIFREYLIKTFGFSRENIYFRTSDRATKGEFDKVFSKTGWINNHTNENSDIIIFYAGHGAPELKNNEPYLVPYDVDPNYASTGYPLNQLYLNLKDIKARSITIIIDACFSGMTRENETLLADARPIGIKMKMGAVPPNVIVFTSASESEISSAYKQKLHGLFTYYFLKGLIGEADSNKDKKIDITEMHDYVKMNVSSQAKKMGREQNPQLLGGDKSRVLLTY